MNNQTLLNHLYKIDSEKASYFYNYLDDKARDLNKRNMLFFVLGIFISFITISLTKNDYTIILLAVPFYFGARFFIGEQNLITKKEVDKDVSKIYLDLVKERVL